MLRIYCRNTGTYKEFQEGTTLLEMLPEFDFERPYDIISAKVNNVGEGLKFRVFNNRDVEFLDYHSYSGRSAYCRSPVLPARKGRAGRVSRLRRRPEKAYFERIFLHPRQG